MKGHIYAPALLVTGLASVSSASAADCQDGSQQTLTGTMSEGRQDEATWTSTIKKSEPCEVFQVKGRGKVPEDCPSDYFVAINSSASGRVKSGILELTNIRCGSKRML
jgi:hypothetical protein